MYIFQNKNKKRTVAAICTMILVVCMSLSTSIPAEARTKVINKVVEMNVSFTGDPDEGVTTGQSQFMTMAELEARAENEHHAAWVKAEAEAKAAWDESEARFAAANPDYVVKEYVGTQYDPLDFSQIQTLGDNLDKIEGIQGIQFYKDGQYAVIDGQLVKTNTIKITFIAPARNNGGSTGGSNESSSESSSGASDHTHNYEWRTITEPTAERDGLKAYVCTICGAYSDAYSESVPISTYSYVCTDAVDKVLTAKQNDTVVLEMGIWHSYPKWFMENLASRSDLTIKLQFEYQNKQYEVTIPAGTEIETECDWYGPLKLCSLYEHTVK